MNWPTLQTAIRTAVATALGLPETQVGWENESDAAAWQAFPCVSLQLKDPRGRGVDQVRYVYDDEAEALVPVHEGPREITLEIRIESDAQVYGEDAVGALSARLRTRLRWESVHEILNTAELALSTIGPTVQMDTRADSRMLSVGLTEVVLLAAESDSDTVSAGSYFDTVEVSSETLDGPDGEPLPDQVSFTIPEE